MSYTHLSARERTGLFYMHRSGYSLRAIARRLDRHHSTLSRELKRNTRPFDWGYCNLYAEHQAQQRRKIPSHQKRYQHKALQAYVNTKLAIGWSPEIISHRIRRDHPNNHGLRVSHETIYQWLYRDAAQGGQAYQLLVRAHKRRRKHYKYGQCRGLIPHRIDISQRPDAIQRRQRYGHWEGDTMVGARRQGRIVTHVERKSRFLMADKITGGTAPQFTQATLRLFKKVPAKYRRSLTLDNGSENAQHQILSRKLKIDVYFARPYASWERGTNENTNGLIRRSFPKGTDFLSITNKQLARVVNLLNHRPRKCLNYQTPFEVFNKVTNGALST